MTRPHNRYESVPEVGDVRIDYRFLEEGVRYAKRLGIARLRIVCPFHGSQAGDSRVLDFSPLANQRWVRSVNVSFREEPARKLNVANLEALYSLGSVLTDLSIGHFVVDLARFSALTSLLVRGNRPVVLGSAPLRSLSYMGSGEKDCRFARGVGTLESVYLQTTKLVTLDGLERLSELEALKLVSAPKLLDASALESCTKLQTIHIEGCKRLNQSFLPKLKAARKLFVDRVDSLNFVSELPFLEHLSFWECLDGDLSPVLKSKSLRESWFSVDRRHFSHSRQEFKRHFDEKHAALK